MGAVENRLGIDRQVAWLRPRTFRPRTFYLGSSVSLNYESLERCVLWTMRPLDDAFLRWCAPWTMCPQYQYDPQLPGRGEGLTLCLNRLGRDCRGQRPGLGLKSEARSAVIIHYSQHKRVFKILSHNFVLCKSSTVAYLRLCKKPSSYQTHDHFPLYISFSRLSYLYTKVM